MTPSEIQNCYERATEVLNGFKKPSERNARDVVALVKHIRASVQPSKGVPLPKEFADLFGFK